MQHIAIGIYPLTQRREGGSKSLSRSEVREPTYTWQVNRRRPAAAPAIKKRRSIQGPSLHGAQNGRTSLPSSALHSPWCLQNTTARRGRQEHARCARAGSFRSGLKVARNAPARNTERQVRPLSLTP